MPNKKVVELIKKAREKCNDGTGYTYTQLGEALAEIEKEEYCEWVWKKGFFAPSRFFSVGCCNKKHYANNKEDYDTVYEPFCSFCGKKIKIVEG